MKFIKMSIFSFVCLFYMNGVFGDNEELTPSLSLEQYLHPLGYERLLMNVKLWDEDKKWLLIPAHDWQRALHRITLKNTRNKKNYLTIMKGIYENGVIDLNNLNSYGHDWSNEKRNQVSSYLNHYRLLPVTYKEFGYKNFKEFLTNNFTCDLNIANNRSIQSYTMKLSQISLINIQHAAFIMGKWGFKLNFLGRKGFKGVSFSSSGNKKITMFLHKQNICIP